MFKSQAFKKFTARLAGTIGALLLTKYLNLSINVGLIAFVLILIIIIFRKDYNEETSNK